MPMTRDLLNLKVESDGKGEARHFSGAFESKFLRGPPSKCIQNQRKAGLQPLLPYHSRLFARHLHGRSICPCFSRLLLLKCLLRTIGFSFIFYPACCGKIERKRLSG